MINDFDITDIEQEMIDIVRSINVTSNIYCNRQKSAPQCNDYAVVRVSGGVTDYDAYGTCSVVIELYARNINNAKNAKKLSYMYKKLVEGLPASSGRYEWDTTPTVIGDTEDDYGFCVRIINLKTIIKVKQ